MDSCEPDGGATHAVTNQPPPLEDYDLFAADPSLVEAVRREGADWAVPELAAFGRRAGSSDAIALGHAAERHPPQLRAFDRFGNRVESVEYHPAYHAMMRLGIEAGIHAIPWTCGRPGGHVAHAALEYMLTQVEPGVCCPITMTYAAIPALERQPSLGDWRALALARSYDGSLRPAAEKGSATFGMAMTEKQGGSDVRANATVARPEGEEGVYRLTGHKWFCSAPMSDAVLTLAQAPGGLTCFLAPKIRPDGRVNAIEIQRLKDKLGNRSNASAEIEYRAALAWRVGEEGRGIATIMEMVRHTRLDAAVVCAGMMRRGAVEAVHHARHRHAFGRPLVDQPAMRAVLADLVLEAEAATALVMRVARAFDGGDEAEAAFARIGSAIAKFWVSKRLPNHAYEALECLGGNGYVEDGPMARFYREAPVNAIWEGSGNVNALDVLRALGRDRGTFEAWRAEAHAARGASAALDAHLDGIDGMIASSPEEDQARRLVEDMALALQGSLLLRRAPGAVGEAFVAARLAGGMRGCAGALPPGLPLAAIIERADVRC
jgi:putative acyl-CoA dehydrogenase